MSDCRQAVVYGLRQWLPISPETTYGS